MPPANSSNSRLEHLDLAVAGAIVLAVLHLKVHRSTSTVYGVVRNVGVSIKNSWHPKVRNCSMDLTISYLAESFYTSIRRGHHFITMHVMRDVVALRRARLGSRPVRP
jgi:hypothetical protein